MLEIKMLKDCWGSYSYFGFKDGRQYTGGYDTIEELVEQYEEFIQSYAQICTPII